MPSLKALAIAAPIVIAVAFSLVFFYAPNDADQGFIQKIFYLHVPLAICALSGFVVLGSEGGGLTAPGILLRLQFLRRNMDL